MPFTVKLDPPIKIAGGKEVSSVEFRDPISEDVFELERPPYRELMVPGDEKSGGDRLEMVQDGKMLRRWMLRLAPPDIDGSTIGAMPARASRGFFQWLVPLLNPEGAPPENVAKNSSAP